MLLPLSTISLGSLAITYNRSLGCFFLCSELTSKEHIHTHSKKMVMLHTCDLVSLAPIPLVKGFAVNRSDSKEGSPPKLSTSPHDVIEFPLKVR